MMASRTSTVRLGGSKVSLGSQRHAAAPLPRRRVQVRAEMASPAEGEPEPEPEQPPPPPAPEPVRNLWYPGGEAPAHLDGTMPGDFGFDPLNLGSDPEYLAWFQQAELQHARWAMLGCAGILFPELATKVGLLNVPAWNVAGEQGLLFGTTFSGLLFTQLFMMGWAEQRRWQDIKEPGSVNADPLFGEIYSCTGKDVGYPGGKWFDPLGFADSGKIAELRQKEIKNGRLAMVSFVGIAAQTFATGKGPIDCWGAHLADPGHQTIFSNIGN